MDILWLTINRENRVMQHFEQFRKTVAAKVKVRTIRKDTQGLLAGKFSQKLYHNKIKVSKILFADVNPNDYDFIFCDAFFAYINENWGDVKKPTSILIEDIHGDIPKWQVEQAKMNGVNIIFHRYGSFHEYHPNAIKFHKCEWLPFAINPDYFKPIKLKKYKVIHTGSIGKVTYPFRNFIVDSLKNKPYFTLIERPTEVLDKKKKQWPHGSDYAKLLGASLIHPTGCSKYKVPTCKYFEIPASGCILVTNDFPDLHKLGFVNNENCLIVNKDTLIPKIEQTLRDNLFRNKLAIESRKLIEERHTLDIRADKFIHFINEYLNKQLII